MKTQKKNCWMPVDEIGYKKKFLTRIIEEKEAESEIKSYNNRSSEMPHAQDVDEEGSVRNLSP